MQRLIILISLLLSLWTLGFGSEIVQVNPQRAEAVTVNVLESYDDFTVIEVLLNHYRKGQTAVTTAPHQLEGEIMFLGVPSEATRLEKGNPDLPIVARSIMIPPRSKMHVEIMESSFTEFTGQVVPSKGSFPRNINPADVPFEFSDVYSTDAFFPENLVELNDPFIMREMRGIGFRVSPFGVNPVQGMIRVYDRIVFRVYADGIDTVDVIDTRADRITKDFVNLYRNHFINYDQIKSRNPNYIEEIGSILVICFPDFMEAMNPYVDWKNQKGVRTVMVPSTEAGTTHQEIRAFIESYWAENPDLAFVQLVGDAAQITTQMYNAPGYGTGASDPSYIMLMGDNSYPDLFIGRFSAETIEHVQTQVERTIWYERDIVAGEWLPKAFGLAGNETGGHFGESDNAHMELIRQRLLNSNTYEHVDAIYQPNQSVTLVDNALNEGRSLINYIAHGHNDLWGFQGGWDYTNTHVNNLINDWMLPHIVSVACLNGNFTIQAPCFAETWLRATNNNTGEPTGAIATYMSSISQPWIPPMYAQDIIADLHIDQSYKTIGGLYYNGTVGMLTAYPVTTSIYTARTWHIFGDASLVVRNARPVAMEVEASDVFFMGMTEYAVKVDTPGALVALYRPDTRELIGSLYADQNGEVLFVLENPIAEPCTLLLTITDYNKITFIQEVLVLPNEGPYLIFDSYSFPAGQAAWYDTNPTMNITVHNIGIEATDNVSFTLISDDPFINITQAAADISVIDAAEYFTISDMFSFEIAKNVPNRHLALFALIAESSEDTWRMNFRVTIYAPVLSYDALQIVELGTDNAIRLNPGEKVNVLVPFTNLGDATSSIGNIVLYSNHPQVTISEDAAIVEPIEVGRTNYAVFTATADEDMARGSRIRLGFFAEFSTNVFQASNAFPVGLLIEDFSTGDFSAFDWTNTSPIPWEISSDVVYEGEYSIVSGAITHDQTSTISITRELKESGTISFWHKVSSEANRDFLQFYLNGAVLGQWSGERDWTFVEFNIPAGEQQFRWVYRKDGSGSAGQDRAWIDYVTFPLSGGTEYTGAVMYVNVDAYDFSKAKVGDVLKTEFRMVNFGNETLRGTISVPDGFTIVPATVSGHQTEEQTLEFNIASNNNVSFELFFRPTEELDYSGNIVILSNDRIENEFLIEISADLTHLSVGDTPALVTALLGNYPNPFNPETTIRFSLSKSQNVEISVYNIRGQLVRNLINEEFSAGVYDVIWNGRDAQDRAVASGIYFYRFSTPEITKVNRMLLMK